VTKIVGGRPKRIWIKTRDRNEFLDLAVYALGMLHVLGVGGASHLGDTAKAMMDKAGDCRALKQTPDDEPPAPATPPAANESVTAG
jgi:phage terminase large subunit GpA-like protein